MNSSIVRAQDRLRRLKQLDGLAAELESIADDVVIPNAQIYPPERPNQSYVRSFTLRDNWKRGNAQRDGRGWKIVVRNETDYAPDVVGSDQGFYFVGRWRTIQKIRAENLPAVRARLLSAVKRLGSR